MAKLLMICPTRGRPARARQMIESFFATQHDADLVLCIDQDDPLLTQYENIHYTYFLPQEPRTTTELINIAFKRLPLYRYYGLVNDDFVFHTKSWDRKLIEIIEEYGDGIAYGNDLLRGGDLPCHFIVTGNIVRALGWLQMPALKHLYGDNVWKTIGEAIGRLYYLPDVIIEHKHWMKDHSLIDETYKRTNSQEMYAQDEKAFKVWLADQSEKDISKVSRFLDRNTEIFFCECGREANYLKTGEAFCDEHWDWKGAKVLDCEGVSLNGKGKISIQENL
jgi:hypothetical protein